MPLPEPAPRRHIHKRSIECNCYCREDGLWDIEARIIDTKSFPYKDWRRGVLEPGMPVHHMLIRLTLTTNLEVVDIDTSIEDAPYLTCFDVAATFKRLIGEKIGPGWRERVRRRIGRREGCTHMIELLDPMATSAYQAMSGGKKPESYNWVDTHRQTGKVPFFVDGCYSWRADGPVLREIFPAFAEQLGKKQD